MSRRILLVVIIFFIFLFVFSTQKALAFYGDELTLTVAPNAGSVAPGGEITYTVKAHNNTANALSNITVTNPIPTGTTYIASSADSGGSFDAVKNQVVWAGKTIAASQALNLTFKVSASPAEVDLYVSPSGVDTNSGSIDAPLKTLSAAQTKVRTLPKTAPINVLLRGGTYNLSNPLELTSQDSGAAQDPITYSSYPGEQAIISGGATLSGTWVQCSTSTCPGYAGAADITKIWKLNIPSAQNDAWPIMSLYASNARQTMARSPNFDGTANSYYKYSCAPSGTGSATQFTFSPGELKTSWAGLNDSSAIIFSPDDYFSDLAYLKNVDSVNNLATIYGGASDVTHGYNCKTENGRYYAENIFDGLDQAKEWYLNRASGDLYYMSDAGVNPNSLTFTASKTNQLLSANNLSYVNFKNLTFNYTDWNLNLNGAYGAGDTAGQMPGSTPALSFNESNHIQISGNTISHLAGQGLSIINSSDFLVSKNEISDTGQDGIRLGVNHTLAGFNVGQENGYNIIENNKISHTSNFFYWGGAIEMVNSSDGTTTYESKNNIIRHNEVSDSPSAGINFGGSGNVVEYNKIHNVMTDANDYGAIYAASTSVGARVSHNLVYDILSKTQTSNFGIVGIYLDAGNNFLVEGNVVDNASHTVEFHGICGNNITNNVFAGSYDTPMYWPEGDGVACANNTLTKNIIYNPASSLAWTFHIYNYKGQIGLSDYNLYSDDGSPNNAEARICNTSIGDDGDTNDCGLKNDSMESFSVSGWKNKGYDANSKLADPQFANYSSKNYTINNASILSQLGIQQVQPGIAQVGTAGW